MTKEFFAHVPLTGDQLDVAVAALERYAVELERSAGPTSSSATVARGVARVMRGARRDVR